MLWSLSIDLSWSFVISLLWSIVSFTDTCLYQRRKLNPYNSYTIVDVYVIKNMRLLKKISSKIISYLVMTKLILALKLWLIITIYLIQRKQAK